jgi:hypothetical protein
VGQFAKKFRRTKTKCRDLSFSQLWKKPTAFLRQTAKFVKLRQEYLKKTYMALEGIFVAKGMPALGTLHTGCLAKALDSLLRLPLTFPFTF